MQTHSKVDVLSNSRDGQIDRKRANLIQIFFIVTLSVYHIRRVWWERKKTRMNLITRTFLRLKIARCQSLNRETREEAFFVEKQATRVIGHEVSIAYLVAGSLPPPPPPPLSTKREALKRKRRKFAIFFNERAKNPVMQGSHGVFLVEKKQRYFIYRTTDRRARGEDLYTTPGSSRNFHIERIYPT